LCVLVSVFFHEADMTAIIQNTHRSSLAEFDPESNPAKNAKVRPCPSQTELLDQLHEKVCGTLPVTEHDIQEFFRQFEEELKSNVEVQQKLLELHKNEALLTEWKKKAKWKNDLSTRPENKDQNFDNQRRNVVKVVAEAADLQAKSQNLPFGKKGQVLYPHAQTPHWEDIGTKSKESDIDFTIRECEKKDTLFQDNAIQAQKSDAARLIFRSQFSDTSANLADAEFYPPHISKYCSKEVREPEAKALYFRASFVALLLQQKSQLKKDDFEKFKKRLGKIEKINLKPLIQDIEALFESLERMRAPFLGCIDLFNSIFCNALTAKMVEIAKEIDKNQSEKLLALLYLYAALRALFLPSGYNSLGAIAVVCKDEGGQEHQTADREREEILEATGKDEKRDSASEGKPFHKSSPQHLFESAWENVAYFFHGKDLIDASKYAKRVFEAALQLLPETQDDEDQKLKDLREFVKRFHRFMSILEGTKRRKWDIYSYEMQAAQATRKKLEKLFLKAVNELKETGNPVKAAILKGSNPLTMVERFVTEFPKSLKLTDSIKFDNFLSQNGRPNGIHEFVHALAKKNEDASKSWFKAGITDNDKETLWSMLVKEGQNRFQAHVEEKVKKVESEAKTAYKLVQYGTKTFEPQTPGKRATLAEKPLMGEQDVAKDDSAHGAGSSSKAQAKPNALRLTRAAKMMRGAHMSVINSQAIAENVARASRVVLASGFKASDFAVIKQAAYSKSEIEKLKAEFGISTEDNAESNTKLFERVKDEMLDFQMKILDFALESQIVQQPNTSPRIDLDIEGFTFGDLELCSILRGRR